MISGEVALAALDMLEVDPQGFDMLDRKLLLTVIEKFDGGPVGVDSLAAAMSEERGTIEDVIEPFLIQQGFLMRTARGRVATRNAYLHFGLRARASSANPICRCSEPRRATECRRRSRTFRLASPRLLGGHRCRRRRLLRQLPEVHGALPHRVVAQPRAWTSGALRRSAGCSSRSSSVAVNFLRPALLNDEVIVTAELARLGGATIRIQAGDLAQRGATDRGERARCLPRFRHA